MLKFAITLFTILAVVTVTITSPVIGQPLAASGPNDPPANTSASTSPEKKKPDLKKVFDDETKKFNAKSAEFDPVKVELEKNKQQAKKGWSKNDKAFIIIFAAAIAVLVVLLVKYGKNCLETSPPNCNIGTDDNCYCERYEEDSDKSRGFRMP